MLPTIPLLKKEHLTHHFQQQKSSNDFRWNPTSSSGHSIIKMWVLQGKIEKSIKSPIISKFKLIEKDEFNRLINILALPSRVGSSSFLTSEANT
jgi:hypothetical protein